MQAVSSFERMSHYVRGTIYWFVFAMSIIGVGAIMIVCFWMPYRFHYSMKRLWARINLYALRVICGLDYEIEGLENIPQHSVIVFSKHQSLYEVLVIIKCFPPIAWVIKRELLWIPIFGWAFSLVRPTPIDRKSGRKAIEQIIQKGRKSLAAGRWVIIFPEGTRTYPGTKVRYKIGGAILATETQYPVLPIAHNAGEYWPRHSLIKWPGTMKLSIGPLIAVKNKTAEQLLQEAETWIENKMQDISDPARWKR